MLEVQRGEQGQSRVKTVGWIVILLAIGLIGLGIVGVGSWATFNAPSGEGSTTLLVAGVALIALATFANTLESLKIGSLELVFRRAADIAEAQGDFQTAKVLKRAANSVGLRVDTARTSYASLRRTLPAGPERTRRMEKILEDAKHDAETIEIDPDEVLRLLWTGSEGARGSDPALPLAMPKTRPMGARIANKHLRR